MTEKEQYLADWEAIITGLIPDLPEAELKRRLEKLADLYDTKHSAPRSKTELTT